MSRQLQYYYDHHEQVLAWNRAYRAERRRWLQDLLSRLMCEDCGSTSGSLFHHRNPEEKSFNVGQGPRCAETMLAEIAKCDVLCSSCHRQRHRLQRGDDGRFLKESE